MTRRHLTPMASVLTLVSILVLVLAAALTDSCGSGCGFRLVSRVTLASRPKNPFDPTIPVPCCGGFLFQDINLESTDIQEVDFANAQVNGGHVDGFLTAPDCARLFDGAYNGLVSQPLCKIYIGPVAAGTVSQRQTIPRGTYRMFVHAWASNETPELFTLDVGIYSDKCQPNLAAPSP